MKATLTVVDASASTDGEASAATTATTAMDYAAMQKAMIDSFKPFPAATQGTGNTLLAPTVLADGTKQFELTAAVTPFEVEPGKTVQAWTYNGHGARAGHQGGRGRSGVDPGAQQPADRRPTSTSTGSARPSRTTAWRRSPRT